MSPPPTESAASADVLPDYLRETYTWAYLSHRTLPWLDRSLVVSAILWGNAGRLMRAAVAEFSPGQRVLQAACVYGVFSPMLAARVGENGTLDVVDVAPIQIANVRRKLAAHTHARARLADLSEPLGSKTYDGVCCFFLLHEVPEDQRRKIVDNLLAAVEPGGKAVFVDYHRCARWNPLAPVMNLVFRTLEPYAPSLLDTPIESMSGRAGEFDWTHRTLFGGLYQHVVAIRRKA
tara:strand:+ start:11995 stop:12696 length:702 start_codon:yes stop_codon:yes gene_type:complete